ncbi:retrovirus-related Pol polyprotein from transposon 17.6 [Trichonephila clavipes]|nr:retrovirus-related Pol polyprotein from transposon 17.6 [Trichonephila clavipes]
MLKSYYKRPEHVNVIINDETQNSLAEQELEIPYLENNSRVYDFEDVIQASELNKYLHDKQIDRLRELLNKYPKCFSNNPGLTNLVEHEIQLVSDHPNLSKGYWRIPLSKTALRYAAICTSFGTYRSLRMSFGLKNAPYFFSKLMAELLYGLEDFVVPYLDDIAIFSDTWESHIKHVETVLQRIKKAKLTIKPSKCCSRVPYSSHENSNTCLLRSSWLLPKYINLFSVIAAPLTDALKGRAKKGEIKWTTDSEDAFRELKRKLTDKPVLYVPIFEREFIVQTDASNVGMGAVLTQLNEQGEEHPTLYLSKKLSEVEKHYCTTENECASIVFAIKKLHYYLDGNSF